MKSRSQLARAAIDETETQVIMIIDDIATNRAIFSRMSASIHSGIVVKVFEKPQDAFLWLDENEVDLIIVDYKMPEMDGAQFVHRFRSHPHGMDTPVVVITAYDDREFRLAALEAGATDFLHSPVDHSEFKTRIRNLLKLSQHQKTIAVRAHALEAELKESQLSRDQVLRDSRERLAQVIDTIPAIISANDRDGRCIFASAYLITLAGLDPGQPNQEIPALFGEQHRAYHRSLDQRVFESGRSLPEIEEEVVDRNGAELTFITTKSPLRASNGDIIGVLTTSMDITARKQAESRLAYLAHHDHLTGLPNRALLHARLQAELDLGHNSDCGFALHFIDLDRFKSINDGLGHYFGDRLLRAVADRLRQSVREGDVVARLGGDEFAVLQRGIRNPEDAEAVARNINAVLDQPFQVGARTVAVNASIGISVHPKDGHDADELLQNADLAMYRAKVGGRRGHRFFYEDMRAQAQSSISIQSDLRRAIAEQQFTLHYQPQINLRTGTITGVEALLRWMHPDHGLMPPAAFLSVAEESGLILPINEWVLREACRQAARWSRSAMPATRVAVNLAPMQFQREKLCNLVLSALEEAGLPPQLLELELTETILLEHALAARSDLEDLRRHGVRFAIDDFGTGHSSLAHLRSVPVDRLKIDQSFVWGLGATGTNDTAIIRAIVGMGREMEIEVLAEGVETVEQARLLQAEGCDLIQGYYFSKPLKPEDFEALCSNKTQPSHTGRQVSLTE